MKRFKKLSDKRLIIIGILGFLVSVVLHNFIYALTEIEEPVFLILAVVVSPIIVVLGIGRLIIRK